MKYLALLMIITTIALVSCIPTTDTANTLLEESSNPSNSVTLEATTGSNIEGRDSELVATTEPAQTSPQESNQDQVEPISTEEKSTMTPSNIEVPSPEKLPQVQTAVIDLAQHLNISKDEIEVVSVEAKTWSDTSMGCPHPEMAYLQVPQDGALIQLSVDGQIYNYHSGGNREPFLCEDTGKTVGVKPTPLNLEDFITPSGNIDN